MNQSPPTEFYRPSDAPLSPSAAPPPAEEAKGDKGARRLKTAGAAVGGAGLLYLLVEKLSPEQIVQLAEKLGGPLILALAVILVGFKVGSRMASAMHRQATELGYMRGSVSAIASNLNEFTSKDYERHAMLTAVRASLGSLHEKMDRLLEAKSGGLSA